VVPGGGHLNLKSGAQFTQFPLLLDLLTVNS
jgi:hypothetical protein